MLISVVRAKQLEITDQHTVKEQAITSSSSSAAPCLGIQLQQNTPYRKSRWLHGPVKELVKSPTRISQAPTEHYPSATNRFSKRSSGTVCCIVLVQQGSRQEKGYQTVSNGTPAVTYSPL